MNGPLASYMRVGIVHPAAFPESLRSADHYLATLQIIAQDDFFSAVELIPFGDATVRRETRSMLAAARKIVDVDAGAGLYSSGLSLCSLDPGSRVRAVDLVRQFIDEAYALGAARVCVISGPDPGEQYRPAASAALTDSLIDLYAYARALGDVELSLKMADRSIDKRFLIGPTRDGIQVAHAVRASAPDFGVVLNLGHLPLLAEQPEHSVRLAAPVLTRVHVGNCVMRDRSHPRYGDTHPPFGIAGGEIGVADLACFLRSLVSVGYLVDAGTNVVAFEVRPGPGNDASGVIAQSKRVLCDAWISV